MNDSRNGGTNTGLFHIISTGQQPAENLADTAAQIMHHIDAVHLREKLWSDKHLVYAIRLLYDKGVAPEKIIVNHRVAAAHIMNAKGVQLTHNSIDVSLVRRCYPDFSIGCSVHSVEEAINASQNGADYVIFGHVFSTRSKPNLHPKGLGALENVVKQVDVPVLAIGGITPENTPDVMQTGASGIAVLSGVLLAKNPLEKVAAYNKALKKGGGRNV